jgi:hypothetical protein
MTPRASGGDSLSALSRGNPVYRLGLLLIFPLLLVSLANAGDDEKKPQKKLPPDFGKKIPPPKRVIVTATVEMKDGTTFLASFRLADAVVLRTPNLGEVTLRLTEVRFLDMEGDLHRVATYAPETFYGLVQNETFDFLVLATRTALRVPRVGIRRLVFPDPPSQEIMP